VEFTDHALSVKRVTRHQRHFIALVCRLAIYPSWLQRQQSRSVRACVFIRSWPTVQKVRDLRGVVCSPPSMRRQGRSSIYAGRTAERQPCEQSTSSVVSMILLRRTCHHHIALRTWTPDVGLGHQLTPTSCWYRGPGWLTLAIARFRSPEVPRTWNNLPATERSAPSLLSIKSRFFLIVIADIDWPNLA